MVPTLSLELEVERPAELLDRWFATESAAGLSLDGKAPAATGTRCLLTVRTRAPRRTFKVEGHIAWARHQGAQRLKTAFGVQFAAGGETAKRLLALAQRDFPEDVSRVAERVALEWPVTFVNDRVTRKGTLRDLSTTGAFLATAAPLAPGAMLGLELKPPRAWTTLRIGAQVAWARRSGTLVGMGIRFLELSSRQVRVLERWVKRAR